VSDFGSDFEKVEVLNRFFGSVFTYEGESNVTCLLKTDIQIEDISITVEMVETKLKSLNVNKSMGPDGIHPRVLKELAKQLSSPLAIIFQKSIEYGSIPKDWRLADISPIYKSGDKSNPSNYRPVSLKCIACKIMESLIRDKLLDHMLKNQLFSNKQFGFIKKRSTILQLLKFMDDLTGNMEDGAETDVIYTDFQKAFDKVPYERLLLKIKCYGINGKLWQWRQAFLEKRQQRVKLKGTRSGLIDVLSGVPQGSVLGPILFVIYINDIADNISNKVLC
jgi:hypothetical protein